MFLLLTIALPALAGGCPDFRDSVVDSLSSATTTVIVDQGDASTAAETAARGVAAALINLLFDQFRSPQSRTSR
jgi:hypothetical protein